MDVRQKLAIKKTHIKIPGGRKRQNSPQVRGLSYLGVQLQGWNSQGYYKNPFKEHIYTLVLNYLHY